MDYLTIAIGAFFIVLAIGIFLYFRPAFISEGFATVALDGESMPKCFLRDAAAQNLLARFQGLKISAPNSESGEDYDEFKTLLQKILCIDADITGSGAGPYSTYQLPFVTAHDIEPAASFVNRCIRNAVRPRDVEIAMDKFETRGHELIKSMCFDEASQKSAALQYHDIMMRVTRNITSKCLQEKATLDIPAGVRDPGYYLPQKVEELHTYSISGGNAQYKP